MKAREKYSQERHARFLANETKKPPEEQMQFRDVGHTTSRPISVSTQVALSRVIRFWQKFCTDTPGRGDVEAISYFEPDGPNPSIDMIRKFAHYVATGQSYGRGDVSLTRRTVLGHVSMLFTVFKREGKPFDRHFQEQVNIWVMHELTEELGLNKNVAVSKPIARQADVTIIIQQLFSPLGLRQVLSMRVILHICIFINLMIDTCGRIHEITATERYPDQYLRWKDVKLYVFNKDGERSLSAVIRVSGQKGWKDSPERYQEFFFNLLPSELWAEDTLRLLLFEAIIDGHIPGMYIHAESAIYNIFDAKETT